MRSFLSSCACNGCRPKRIGPPRQYARPRLMKRLLSERHVARFLIGPAGMGKTTLALEYAESIFSWRDVHWVDCQSPCFLRDLDLGIIAENLMGQSGSATGLVVFEDVPYLDDQRAARFSEDLDALLEHEWEVIAVTTPAFDAMAARQPDCICVRAQDLLVDDLELEQTGCGTARSGISRAERVPALVWGTAEDAKSFFAGMHAGEMPGALQLAVFVMLALQDGTYEDIAAFCGAQAIASLGFVAQHYPYTGISEVDEEFSTVEVEPADLIEAFADGLAVMAASSLMDSRDSLIAHAACALLAKKEYRRACDFVRAGCTRRQRIEWAAQHQGEVTDAGHVLAMQDVFDSFGPSAPGVSADLLVGAALRQMILGDELAADALAHRAMSKSDCPPEVACAAALLRAACSHGPAPDAKVRRLLDAAVQWSGVSPHDCLSCRRRVLACMALAAKALDESGDAVLATLAPCEDLIARDADALAFSALLLTRAFDGEAPESRVWSETSCAGLIVFSVRCLHRRWESGEPLVLSEVLLRTALRECAGEIDEPEQRGRDAAAMALRVEGQRRLRQVKRRVPVVEHAPHMPHRLAAAPLPVGMVPEMQVHLFGGMEVVIGGRTVDPKFFYKQKAKLLLAVLALYRGREVPKSELFRILWPLADKERAAGNFYPLWSVLVSALSDDRGNCPYLVRHQASYQVDGRYVRCDVEEFEELCRRLSFDDPDPHVWLEIFSRLQERFSCELLPSETKNPYIVDFRDRTRTRLVDAYVRAAGKLCEVREPESALWFAQAALDLCQNREDVYLATMRSQMLAGKRTCAIETYFRCRDYMAAELGLDPSEEMTHLYEQLICEGKQRAAS